MASDKEVTVTLKADDMEILFTLLNYIKEKQAHAEFITQVVAEAMEIEQEQVSDSIALVLLQTHLAWREQK